MELSHKKIQNIVAEDLLSIVSKLNQDTTPISVHLFMNQGMTWEEAWKAYRKIPTIDGFIDQYVDEVYKLDHPPVKITRAQDE